MSDPDPKQRLDALEAKIAAARAARDSDRKHQEEHYSQAQVAWRMVTEMVAGLGIGFGIGYGLDMLLGTTPWLMVLFTVLGIVAGVRVMMRTADELQTTAEAAEGKSPADEAGNGTKAETATDRTSAAEAATDEKRDRHGD
nr:AtpZ/AtpI family protein [Salipiger mucosus]